MNSETRDWYSDGWDNLSDEEVSDQLILGNLFIRDQFDLDSVWIQLLLLFIGLISILSIGYILLVSCVITCHHKVRDPHTYVIPAFISNAYQFSSDEEEFDEEEIEVLAKYEDYMQKAKRKKHGAFYFPERRTLYQLPPVPASAPL